jgi:DNA-binding CsgD family transcriptional regulator
MDDFIVYDHYHNLTKNRTTREGFIVHYAPIPSDCSKYEVYSREWQECKCIDAVGGDENAAKLVAMYRNGVPIDAIMRHFNLSSPHCVYVVLRLYGVSPRRKYNARGRLSREELERIRQMYLEGRSIYSIAKELGRPPSTIYYALKRMNMLGGGKQ